MKKEVIVAVLLILIILLLLFFPKREITREDAEKFVLEDLRSKYPDGEAEILWSNLTKTNETTYYTVKAKVSKNVLSPCPERIHIYYNYPPQGFVPQEKEYIAKGCKICINEPKCILAFEEEAIIASHSPDFAGREEVHKYITEYADAVPAVKQLADGTWKVKWDSKNANYTITVFLSRENEIKRKLIEKK